MDRWGTDKKRQVYPVPCLQPFAYEGPNLPKFRLLFQMLHLPAAMEASLQKVRSTAGDPKGHQAPADLPRRKAA